MHQKLWQLKDVSVSSIQQLAQELSVSPLIARLLLLRGIKEVESAELFLNPQLKNLPNPFDLKDMDKAVSIIIQAIEQKKKIVVFGDYDVDGTVASSLLTLFFKESGFPIDYYIPHRLREGYSLNKQALQNLKDRGVDLIITVDNGISAVKECEFAREIGLQVIVTDHHHVPDVLPEAAAIINPQQKDCLFPAKEICGSGVAFFLMMALRSEFRKNGCYKNKTEPHLASYLDLLAIATVADVVPLVGANRIIVKHGLKIMQQTRWPGLQALIDVAQISGPLNAFDLGFKLGPRINACGRLYDASTGVQLLTNDNHQMAQMLAKELDKANRERREIESKILEEARNKVLQDNQLRYGYVLSESKWHPGVIGIVASRLVEAFNRPFILLGADGDNFKGSARSYGPLSMVDALKHCSELLIKYGGHKAAAGLSVSKDNLPAFTDNFDQYVKNHLSESDFVPRVFVDAQLAIEDVNNQLYSELQQLEPYGMGNPEPVFMSEGILVGQKQVVGDKHLKLKVGDQKIGAIAFNQSNYLNSLGKYVDLAYQLTWDSWAQTTSLKIKDFK